MRKRSLTNHLYILLGLLIIIAFTLKISVPVYADGGGWITTGAMNTPRPIHTSTLLLSGEVLVAGGDDPHSIVDLASAELYDPVSGNWTFTGSMNVGRRGHRAVRLLDGKVLVVGGLAGSVILSSAELYDPTNGTWTATGSMNIARYSDAAILLQDGRVLVAGGCSSINCGDDTLASAELYDPVDGTWSYTGPLKTARGNNHAVLLLNGNVLYAGGAASSGQDLLSAELFDPTKGTWSDTAPMNYTHGHSNPTVLLSNGKVIVTGTSGSSVSELYDPDANTWTPTGSMNAVRRGHIAVRLPNGSVLAAGGSIFGGPGDSKSAEIYDPESGIWDVISSMNYAHLVPVVAKLNNGNILVTGGTYALGGAELYDFVPPTVTVEQAVGQPDPTYAGPIEFTATFSEPVTGFENSDVDLSGSTTGGALSASITGAGPVYTITVTGMTGGGIVVISIPSGTVIDAAGNPNSASTSQDNAVTLAYPVFLPLVLK